MSLLVFMLTRVPPRHGHARVERQHIFVRFRCQRDYADRIQC